MSESMGIIAARLLGGPVTAISPARAGGNNRIYRVEDVEGRPFALKFYPPQDEDPRDRLGAEWEALSFLSGHGMAQVPQPLAMDRSHHCALYQWLGGEPPAPSAAAVEQLADFLASIQALTGVESAGVLRPASAACFSGADVLAQLEERRRRLDGPAADHAGLAVLLAQSFDPLMTGLTARARHADLPVLELSARALSPSDFGFHNALADTSGRLGFVDFEYFGWDDPVKAVSDVMLHPGMELSEDMGRLFLARVGPVFAARDDRFFARLGLLYPLFALIWCLIVLNEFLPERWARRALAGGSDDREAAQSRQLDKARRRLDWIEKAHDSTSVIF